MDDLKATQPSARIDIWLSFYREITDPIHVMDMRALLSDEERIQEQRFRFAEDRHRYLVTRALVRTVLARYAPIAPRDWIFSRNAYGRPEIANSHAEARRLSFNVSHTSGLIALGVSNGFALGIDVENWKSRDTSLDIANSFFSAREASDLASVSEALRQERFFEYWTFKESYIKARGMGLSIPLDRFSFHFPCARTVCMTLDPSLEDHESRWQFWQLRPCAEYMLAVCAERMNAESSAPVITVRKTVPMLADSEFEIAVSRSSESVRT